MKKKKPLLWWHGFPFWDGLALGLLLGIISTIIVFWVNDVGRGLIHDNVTSFFAIVASLSAALISLFGVRSRLNHDIVKKEEETKNKFIASKAELPSALSHLIGIARLQIKYSIENPKVLNDISPPLRPSAFDPIKECIEYADPQSQKWLAMILMRYQIIVARASSDDHTKSVNSKISFSNNISLINRALDWAEFEAIVSNVFKFSRSEVDTISPFNSERIEDSFFEHIFSESLSELFYKVLKERRDFRKDATPESWVTL